MDEYRSKSQHYVEVFLQQPGINEKTTLGELKEILANTDKAKLVDQRADAPFYRQEKISFFRIMQDAADVLLHCSANAIKAFLTLSRYMSQSNKIAVSKKDLESLIGLSKPTLNKALQELKQVGLLTTEERDVGQGESNVYCINPAVAAMGKLDRQSMMENNFWKLFEDDDIKKHFQHIQQTEAETFNNNYIEKTTGGKDSFGIYTELQKRDKQLNQSKKSDGAANTARTQAQARKNSSTQNIAYESEPTQPKFELDANLPFSDINMQNVSDALTPAENAIFERDAPQ